MPPKKHRRKGSSQREDAVMPADTAATASSQAGAFLPMILIVDDEEAMAKVLCHKFEKNGFQTIRALNGTEAIDLMAKQKMDVVLLDILMPGKDGFSVLTDMEQTMNSKTPVFMLTNYGQEENISRCHKLGAHGCFVKAHTSMNELVSKIRAELHL
ncbi:MAG: two-component system, OmpR family, response regulator VicR [Candidatus Peregrinibacteria bacterium Greene0416_19]|nr:MAG: two-component system, OmpR family, response regulator VicR [Candidatus Peregrinibacteria bacterium Greene0416_19]